MKSIICFLFVLLGAVSFGQSAKKMNKKLLADFALEQQKQDSAMAIFNQTKREFDSIKKLTYKKIYELSDLESAIKRQALKVSDLMSDLKELGIDLNSIGSDYSKEDELPTYREVVRPIKETMKKEVNFDKVSNRLYLEQYKLKEQNAMLTDKVKEYQDYSKYNSIHQQDLEWNLDELITFLPKLDSLSTVYQLFGNELGSKRVKLMDKLGELYGNYIAKGPNGFPEAYNRIFYYAFPPSEQEMTRDVDLSHVELADGPYDLVEAARGEEMHRQQEEVFTTVDEQASFPGGNSALITFLANNYRVPQIAKELRITGKVQLKFIVSEDGSVSDVKVEKGCPDCPECDAEAIRIMKKMPKWKPGKFNGKAVKSWYSLPIQIHVGT